MSCSQQRATTISYMSPGLSNNVLWEVQPSPESDAAFHYGADISLLSHFAEESKCYSLRVQCWWSKPPVMRNRGPSDLVEENGSTFAKFKSSHHLFRKIRNHMLFVGNE